MREVKTGIQRQTAYVATERGHLHHARRTGQGRQVRRDGRAAPPSGRTAHHDTNAYGCRCSPDPRPLPRHRPSDVAAAITAGTPIITIKFNLGACFLRARALRGALSQALAAKPSTSFNVVAVSSGGAVPAGPTRMRKM